MKIEKEQKPIIAHTASYKVTGKVFIPPGGRISDFISSTAQRKFIAVADAVVTDIFGKEICKADFLELNRDEIIFLIPGGESGE